MLIVRILNEGRPLKILFHQIKNEIKELIQKVKKPLCNDIQLWEQENLGLEILYFNFQIFNILIQTLKGISLYADHLYPY